MKTLQILALTLFISGCANAQSSSIHVKLDVVGESLPAIRHINDMKMSGDTLFFVYEGENGYGQRLLRRAVFDIKSHTLRVSPDMGKREDGYFVSYMPYPFIADNGTVGVISQDDCELYTIVNDTTFVRTKQYLMSGDSKVPFPLSQFVQDVFMTGPDRYVFIGREPYGGRQFAMTADITSSRIDTIRQINISPDIQAWMPNSGEMAYSGKYNRLTFAYRLHPVIEIFGSDGSVLKTIEVAESTFDPATLEEADFEDLNILHFTDITTTNDYIYALYWGHRYNRHQSADTTTSIYKIDWNGNIVDQSTVNADLRNIAVYNDNILIGWTGKEFIVTAIR